MYDPEVLQFLGEVGKAYNDILDNYQDTELRHWFPLGLRIESHGEFLAELYEEGWSFTDPKSKE
jgi:hypothetical protein